MYDPQAVPVCSELVLPFFFFFYSMMAQEWRYKKGVRPVCMSNQPQKGEVGGGEGHRPFLQVLKERGVLDGRGGGRRLFMLGKGKGSYAKEG